MLKISVLLLFIMFFTASCTKKSGETLKTDSTSGDKNSQTEKNPTGEKSGTQTAANDTVFFAEWNGKKLIIEDNYSYADNEKKFTDKEGNDYYAYGEKLKNIVKKYSKYDEQNPEYYFGEFKPEFSGFTSLKPGRKIFVSTPKGIFQTEINGYYINLDDMIGGGVIFYATADLPKDFTLGERDLVICSYNSNMSKSDLTGVTEQSLLDKFKSALMPVLKDITVVEYDAAGNETSVKLKEIKNDEMKIFKGNFTAKGGNEFLVGVNLRNNATNFSSGIWVMDENGKIIKEFKPLEINNFTFGTPHMVIDYNGDGIMEVITSDGYYEGGGYNFHKFSGGEFKTITTGFIFGV